MSLRASSNTSILSDFFGRPEKGTFNPPLPYCPDNFRKSSTQDVNVHDTNKFSINLLNSRETGLCAMLASSY